MWSADIQQGRESTKIAPFVVHYLQGKVALDIGCGLKTVWPSLIGIDNCKAFGDQTAAAIRTSADDLRMFADGSVDAVFSSHLLEHFPKSHVPAVLREWARVLKIGGHLVLYIPNGNDYPKLGDPNANPDHKWDPLPGDVESMLPAVGGSWTQLECEERSEGEEYSLFLVFRKEASGPNLVEDIWQRNPDGKKRALLIRYGAIGDIIQTAGTFPLLREQGYHLTVNCKQSTHEVIRHDPNVDAWILQDTDFVPNHLLGPYWDVLSTRYDLVVNHCESIEGSLLAMPGRLNHAYTDEARRKLTSHVNYHERLHDIAGVPHVFRGARFYTTERERYQARKFYESLQPKDGSKSSVIAWALNGSSQHKVYPFIQVVVGWLMEKTRCTVVLMADGGIGKQIQDAIIEVLQRDGIDTTRVIPKAGIWSIREALSFVQLADCVVGPETGTLNAVAFNKSVPKVIYLSHSTHENLTKHWPNTRVLTADRKHAPCYPCHRMHFNWEYCHQSEKTAAALCASSISPETIYDAVMQSLGAIKASTVSYLAQAI